MSVYIIAEMACSHDGSPELARRIARAAGEAGANAVQLQIWTPDEVVVPSHPAHDTLCRLQLSREVWAELIQETRRDFPRLDVIGCVYGQSSADFCDQLAVDAFKLHVTDLTHERLLRHVARKARRIDLSVGGGQVDEIERALGIVFEETDVPPWLMYGYQAFPTLPDRVHLSALHTLHERFGLRVGYQDHSDANTSAAYWMPAAALGMGVDVLEKHMTHDRAMRGADHEAALNPNEFAEFVKMVRTVERAQAQIEETPAEELVYRQQVRRSLVAARPIPQGTRVEAADVVALRTPRPGLPPEQLDQVVGHDATRDLSAFEVIEPQDVGTI